jgi:hypothetical protein
VELSDGEGDVKATGLLSADIFDTMYQESATLRALISHQETLDQFSAVYSVCLGSAYCPLVNAYTICFYAYS